MSNEILEAHSATEAHFYVMIRLCQSCQSGPLRAQQVTTQEEHISTILKFECRCQKCEAITDLYFKMDSQYAHPSDTGPVNPTNHPSQIIDLSQWVALFHHIIAKASQENNKQESRRLGYEAALCLEEALKFYDNDNDLPPDRAFFSEKAKEIARRQPGMFLRSKLLEQRAKLPNLHAMIKALQRHSTRHWWQFWRN